MKRDTPEHTLFLNQMTAAEALVFLTAVQSVLFNMVWHLNSSFDTLQTYNVYCELQVGDLAQARSAIETSVGSPGGMGERWHLLPNRL